MLFKFIPATLATLSFLSSVSAWGPLGHSTVAYIAMNFLSTPALKNITSILSADPSRPNANPTLVDVANWAVAPSDFALGFHYVDANDNPPTSCEVDFKRDCGAGGCTISAIMNYTERVQDASLDAEQRAEALKFLVHLFGDITQPLNVDAVENHGLHIIVDWDGVPRNLHGVWDIFMPARLAGADPLAGDDFLAVVAWTNTILEKILFGALKSLVPIWRLCTDINQAQLCATEWASDANALVCSYVLSASSEGGELDGTYYDGAAPIIEMQIAKAGVRLAAWLNIIFTGSIGF